VKLIGPTNTRLSGQRKTLDSAEAAELKRLKSVRFSTCSDSDTDDCGAADLLASGESIKSLGRRSLTIEAGETWQKLSQFTGLKVGTCTAAGSAGGPGDEISYCQVLPVARPSKYIAPVFSVVSFIRTK
jgi:hypothetical protein